MAYPTSPSPTRRLVRLAAMVAIILVMAFTPLGYFRTGGLSITLLQIPVVVGAIILGPSGGAVLGAVFGLTSLVQCFGLEPFGTTLMGINPLGAALTCLVPRILMGLLSGLLFQALTRSKRSDLLPYAVTCLCGALLNTAFFMGMLVLFFYQTPFIQGMAQAMGALNPIAFIALFVGLNGLIEAAVCCVGGAVIARTLHRLSKRVD